MNLKDQARASEQGKQVYCLRCLNAKFHPTPEKLKTLTSADPGDCPACDGPGPLFYW